MRTRSKLSDPVLTPSSIRFREWAGDQWYSWNSLGGTPTSFIDYNSQTMVDQKTPGYFKAVREGTVIPVSPMTSEKTTVVRGSSRFNVVHARKSNPSGSKYEYEVDGTFAADREWGIEPESPVVNGNLALQEALSRAQSDCYDALTFAAEFRKTVEGVVTLRSRAMTIFERFNERVRATGRKKRFRGLEASQILAEIWLELRYMWRPLVYDMMSAQEAISRLAAGIEDPLQRAYATREGSASSSAAYQTGQVRLAGTIGSVAGLNLAVTHTVNVDVTVHAAVGLQVTTREITMVDPFVTGWELVPFSFVLDWFVSIGDLLTAFSPFATGQLQYASLATRTTTTYRSNFKIVPSSKFQHDSGTSELLTIVKIVEKYERVKATPKPTLAFDVNLNVAKLIDLVALWNVSNRKTILRLLRHF